MAALAADANDMISAEPDPQLGALAERLTAKAKSLAEAAAVRMALARRGDPRRWRQAGLVWPLFFRR